MSNRSKLAGKFMLGTALAILPGWFASLGQEPKASDTPAAVRPGLSASAPQKPKDSLLFRNGDLLYGNLQSIDPPNAILWQHPDALQPIEFKPDAISEIQFGHREQPQSKLAYPCHVRLINQDELAGNLVSGDSEKVILETWYAGKIEMPRKVIQFIMPQIEEGPLIFAGPTGVEGWTIGKVTAAIPNVGEWKYKAGAFYAGRSASIARDLKLPDVAKIECDLTWKGMFNVAIALYTDYMHPVNLTTKESGPDFGGFYSLQLNNYMANLVAVTKNDPLRYLGQAPVQAFNQKSKVHLDMRVNKAKRTISLLVDGVLVKQWTESEEDGFIGKGTGVRIVHQGQGTIKIANLRVSEWNGAFEEKPSPTPNSKEDIAKLQNGDRVIGQLQTIQDGKITFAPAGAPELDIPLSRVKLLEMAARVVDRAGEEMAETRATFRNGGSITLRLEKWNENEVIGSSPHLGRVRFNPLAFQRIQFNPRLVPKPTAVLPAEDFRRGRAVVRAVRGFAEYNRTKVKVRSEPAIDHLQ